jgi:hypothetical protein
VHTDLHLIYKLEPSLLMMVILLRGHPPESTSTNVRIALDIGEEEEEEGGGEERAVVVMPILMIMTWRTTDNHDS